MLAETTEIFGAEQLLVSRARNRAVAERYLSFVKAYKEYLVRFGGSFDDNPSPGNKEGGLTNILEKSLGAVAKAGSSPMNDAVDYAERVHGPGFAFMNTPGYDPVSLTGLAAGGCNLIAFTTGRGSAIGFPTIPVIKIATNSEHLPPHARQHGRERRRASPTATRRWSRSGARSSTWCCGSLPENAPAPSASATRSSSPGASDPYCRGGYVRPEENR